MAFYMISSKFLFDRCPFMRRVEGPQGVDCCRPRLRPPRSAFPENLARELTTLAATGTDDDVGFILQVLRAYQGQQTTYEVVKELVARLPEDDPRL
jgi:hypothetical protein